MVAISPVPFLMIGLIIVFILLSFSGGGITTGGYRPRPRHWIVRLVCGLVGVGLLIAMGVWTQIDIRKSYRFDRQRQSLTVQVPARPEPVLPKSFVDYKHGRALIHFVFMDDTIEPAVPVYVKAFTVNWPEDKEKRRFSDHFTTGALAVNYSFYLNLMQPQPSGDNSSSLLTMGDVYLSCKRNGIGEARSNNLHSAYCSGGYLANLGYGVIDKSPFSLVRLPPQRLQVLAFVSPLADDDPLQAVNLDTFGNLYKTKIVKVVQHRSYREYDPGSPYITVSLARYLGGSAVVLLLAAALLSQVFTRRQLALVGMMVIVLLYVAILDRATLSANFSRLGDVKAPVANRVMACRQMQNTFFYRHTAVKELADLIENKSTPPSVSDVARQVKHRLEEGL